MKTTLLSLVAAVFTLGLSQANAQNYVLESSIAVIGTVTTQGTEKTTTGPRGTQIKRLQVNVKPWTNREILAEMNTRSLLGGSTSGWSLVYLQDADSQGGIYARKSGVVPVAVPADLVTLPAYSIALQTGTETTHANGSTFVGVTEIAVAQATVRGHSVNGLASNGVRTLTVVSEGNTYLVDTVSLVMNYSGGGSTSSANEIVKGRIAIGAAKVSTIAALP
jgi:hypothetical protein